jgi:hypothetical protein
MSPHPSVRRSVRPLRRAFHGSRLAPAALVLAYELLLPGIRRPLPLLVSVASAAPPEPPPAARALNL